MTSKDNAQDEELLARYRRASDTDAAAPSESVRSAILAESRRVAEQLAKKQHPFDVSRPAANDARWKITGLWHGRRRPAGGTADRASLLGEPARHPGKQRARNRAAAQDGIHCSLIAQRVLAGSGRNASGSQVLQAERRGIATVCCAGDRGRNGRRFLRAQHMAVPFR